MNVPAEVAEDEPLLVEAVEFFDEEEVAVYGATEEPATEQVEMNADCATLAALPLHMLAIACCTSVASPPQMEVRLAGWSCVFTALRRHAGGVSARTRTAREARKGRITEAFILQVLISVLVLNGKREFCLG